MKTRILVIDDEDHIRRVMRMTLEAAGYEVGEAADGPRGLRPSGTARRGMRCCWTSGCQAWTASRHYVA